MKRDFKHPLALTAATADERGALQDCACVVACCQVQPPARSVSSSLSAVGNHPMTSIDPTIPADEARAHAVTRGESSREVRG
jgi:hypothetical protein